MKTIAVLLFCVLVGVGLLQFVSIEYRIAAIAALVVLSIIDTFADEPQKRRALEFAKNGILQTLRPPLSFVLWLGDLAGDVLPILRLAPLKGLSRAELKRHWVESWMTAPARYLRLRGGK